MISKSFSKDETLWISIVVYIVVLMVMGIVIWWGACSRRSRRNKIMDEEQAIVSEGTVNSSGVMIER